MDINKLGDSPYLAQILFDKYTLLLSLEDYQKFLDLISKGIFINYGQWSETYAKIEFDKVPDLVNSKIIYKEHLITKIMKKYLVDNDNQDEESK